MHSGGAPMLIVPFQYLLWTLLVPKVATEHQCETTCVLRNLLFQNCAEQNSETERVLQRCSERVHEVHLQPRFAHVNCTISVPFRYSSST